MRPLCCIRCLETFFAARWCLTWRVRCPLLVAVKRQNYQHRAKVVPVEVQHPLFEALGIKLFDQAFNPEWPLYSADYVDWLHVAWRLKYQVRVIATQNSCGWCQGGVNAGAAQQRVLPLSVGDVVMLSCSAANMLT